MIAISKDKSQLIKGIVIIMMIFLHLFNKNHTDLCVNLIYIGDQPFAKWLSNACGPVGFFLLLSGYGLAYTYEKGNLSFTKQLKRIFKLYMHYWIILAVFLSIGYYIYADRYPGSWQRIIINATGWKCDYNFEMWFLFPYSLVALTSYYIIKAIEKIGYLRAVLLTACINFSACYIISRYHATILADNSVLAMGVVYAQFLYPFTVGVTFCRAKFQIKWHIPSWLALLMMVIAITIVATINISVTYIVYVPLMTFLFCQLSYPKWLDSILTELGRKSMPMWMIHTWYCNYLFQEQVYSLKYPIFILGVVVIISYLTALPFMWITKKVIALINIK